MNDEHYPSEGEQEAPPSHLEEFDKTQRTWAMGCHLATFAGYFIPLGNILGPLVIWMIKREEMPLVDDQGKEAVNFQISLTIYLIISALLVIVLIGFALLLALIVFDVVVTIIAAMRANEGEFYRYPLCIRFIN